MTASTAATAIPTPVLTPQAPAEGGLLLSELDPWGDGGLLHGHLGPNLRTPRSRPGTDQPVPARRLEGRHLELRLRGAVSCRADHHARDH